MIATGKTVDDYIESLPADRKEAVKKLRQTIKKNLPAGFSEVINYGMPSYVVPHSLFPAGYHCDPKLPLPFLSFANQKGGISLYHMGMYADQELLSWFRTEYSKYCKGKPDIGKSCVKFKKPDEIPYLLIGELVSKMKPGDWISLYQRQLQR